MPFDLAVQQEALGQPRVALTQDEDSNSEFLESAPAGLSAGGVTRPEQALYLRDH